VTRLTYFFIYRSKLLGSHHLLLHYSCSCTFNTAIASCYSVTDRDYCINPDVLANPPPPPPPVFQEEKNLVTNNGDNDNNSVTMKYQKPVRHCSSNNPCGQCEGDCDNDSHCAGNLKCFQKNGAADIPGCTGRETSRTDFCYDPSM
jgi:hypothetical protein